MADSFDFPDSPYIGQPWTINGFDYYWTGVTWDTDPLLHEYTRETMYCSVDDDFSEIGNPATAPDYWATNSDETSLWRAEREYNSQGQSWSNWQVSALKGRDGYTYFTSTVYVRSASEPASPIGGSFSAPVPDGWFSEIPTGDAPLWASTRTFMADPTPSVLYEPLEGPETALWSGPVQLTDIGYPEVLSSPLEAPGNPTDIPGDWATIGGNGDLVKWVAIRVIRNGVAGAWNITRVLGVDGDDGLDGVDGESARGVTLTVDTQAFTYNSAGQVPAPATTTVYATAQNTTGTVFYEFFENGVVTGAPTTNNYYTYTPTANYADMPVKLEVRIREGSAVAAVVAVDQFSMFGVRPSSEVIYVDSTQLSSVVSADSEGIPKAFTNTGVDFDVWIGGVKAPYAATGAGSYSVSAVATGCTAGAPYTTAGVTRKYPNITAMPNEVASIVFTVTVRDNAGSETVYEKIQSITKTRDGGLGAGVDARIVSLSTTTQAFEYDSAGGAPYPTTATISATSLSTEGVPYYEFVIDGVSMANTTTSTYLYTPKSVFLEMPDSVKVNLREGGTTGTVVASDIITLFGLRENSDGITISLSNEAHVIPSNNQGIPTSFEGSGTSIKVWRGTLPLTYGASGANTFSVTAAAFSLTAGDATTFNTFTRNYANITALTANVGSLVFSVTVRDAQGGETVFSKTQSFTKSTDGQDGTSSNMPFVSMCFIRSATKPNQPTGGSWLSALPTNAAWSDGIPAGTLQIWQTSRVFTSDGLSPQSASWSDPSAISNTQTQEYMWSSVPSSPGNPTDNAGNWSATPNTTTIWQAVRQILNGVSQAWVIIKIRGEDGTGSTRGFNFFTVGSSTGVWSDALASAATTGGVPVTNDVVTVFKLSDPSVNTTKFWNGSAWEAPADGGIFFGSIIVDGSIIGRHIAASISMTTPRMNGGILNGGTVQLIGSSYMSVQSQTPFGPDNLLEWRGPRLISGTGDDINPDYSLLTKANALAWFDSTGSQYYGGSLSAGILKTSVQNTTKVQYTVGEVVATVGPFSTNGNSKNVVISHSMRASSNTSGASCPVNPTAAQFSWKLERKIGTGAWAQVATGVSSGYYHCEDGEGAAIILENMSSSVTYTDTSTSTDDFNYRVVCVSYNRYSAVSNISSQQVSIISTEG